MLFWTSQVQEKSHSCSLMGLLLLSGCFFRKKKFYVFTVVALGIYQARALDSTLIPVTLVSRLALLKTVHQEYRLEYFRDANERSQPLIIFYTFLLPRNSLASISLLRIFFFPDVNNLRWAMKNAMWHREPYDTQIRGSSIRKVKSVVLVEQ